MSEQDVLPQPTIRPRRIVVQPLSAHDHCMDCEVRHTSVCSALDVHDLPRLAALAQQITVPAGQVFISDGTTAEHFYNVTHGTVRLYKLLPDGRRQITGFAGPGHFLGLAVSTCYAFDAEAIDDVTLCRFSRARLHAILGDLPSLERRLLEVAASELVLAQEQMLLLGRKTARERLASFLVHMLPEGCIAGTDRATLHLPMPRGDIADYIGLTVETVSRSFSGLKSAGLIAIPNHVDVIVRDIAGLRQVADGA